MAILTLEIDRDVQIKPRMQRIMLKAIRNQDDLDQLYLVLRDCLEAESTLAVEVWEDINEEEVAHAGQAS